MKRFFTEPDMRVIELNFNENIAASGDTVKKDLIGTNIPFNVNMDDTIVETGVTMDAVNTLINGPAAAAVTYGLNFAQDALLNSLNEHYNKNFHACVAME